MVLIGRIWYALIFIEAVVFLGVASQIGFLKCLLLCALGGLAGSYLLKVQGMEALNQFFSPTGPSGEDVFRSLCLIFAGLLFIFPGFVSDALGLALLVPAVRSWVRSKNILNFGKSPGSAGAPDDGIIIEGDYEVVDEKPAAIEKKDTAGRP